MSDNIRYSMGPNASADWSPQKLWLSASLVVRFVIYLHIAPNVLNPIFLLVPVITVSSPNEVAPVLSAVVANSKKVAAASELYLMMDLPRLGSALRVCRLVGTSSMFMLEGKVRTLCFLW